MAMISAPIPAIPSAGLQARRGIVAPTPNPMAAPVAPVEPRSRPTVAPVAYAMDKYQEPGDPFTAAAQGWVNATNLREMQAAGQGALDAAAEELSASGHDDLARYVRTGIMGQQKAVEIALGRDETMKKTETETARRGEIANLLRADPELAKYADPFESGAISEDAIWDVLKPSDGEKAPAGYRYTEEGDLEAIPGGPADKDPSRREPPQGYRWTDSGDMEPIPGGPADKKSGGRKLTAAEIKELFEAQDGVAAGEAVVTALDRALELNQTAWDGPLADIGTQAGALVGDANSVDTQELKNLVTAQALDQLRATFGAMPTEGERKILLEIQGSVNQPREVRRRIFERAKEAAQRRIRENQQKAEGIQSGEYMQSGYDPTGNTRGANEAAQAPEGIDPSIWEEMTPEERALWQ